MTDMSKTDGPLNGLIEFLTSPDQQPVDRFLLYLTPDRERAPESPVSKRPQSTLHDLNGYVDDLQKKFRLNDAMIERKIVMSISEPHLYMDPTDIDELMAFLEREFRDLREHAGYEGAVVNLSSGTPAMYTALHVLLSWLRLPNAVAYQVKNPEFGPDRIHLVPFERMARRDLREKVLTLFEKGEFHAASLLLKDSATESLGFNPDHLNEARRIAETWRLIDDGDIPSAIRNFKRPYGKIPPFQAKLSQHVSEMSAIYDGAEIDQKYLAMAMIQAGAATRRLRAKKLVAATTRCRSMAEFVLKGLICGFRPELVPDPTQVLGDTVGKLVVERIMKSSGESTTSRRWPAPHIVTISLTTVRNQFSGEHRFHARALRAINNNSELHGTPKVQRVKSTMLITWLEFYLTLLQIPEAEIDTLPFGVSDLEDSHDYLSKLLIEK